MKLRFDYGETFPVYTVSEVNPESAKMFVWDAIEMTDKEWQDYQVVSQAYADWQERLGKWTVERVAPSDPKAKARDDMRIELGSLDFDDLDEPVATKQFLGHGRVWDGRTDGYQMLNSPPSDEDRDTIRHLRQALAKDEDDGA